MNDKSDRAKQNEGVMRLARDIADGLERDNRDDTHTATHLRRRGYDAEAEETERMIEVRRRVARHLRYLADAKTYNSKPEDTKADC